MWDEFGLTEHEMRNLAPAQVQSFAIIIQDNKEQKAYQQHKLSLGPQTMNAINEHSCALFVEKLSAPPTYGCRKQKKDLTSSEGLVLRKLILKNCALFESVMTFSFKSMLDF